MTGNNNHNQNKMRESSQQTSPDNIRQDWYSLVRRLQAAAKQQGGGGLTIITVSIIVDQDGYPQFWLEPRCRKIEPRRSAEEILAMLAAASRDGVVS